jgi:membrane fusion protein (multidrug efflux system)
MGSSRGPRPNAAPLLLAAILLAAAGCRDAPKAPAAAVPVKIAPVIERDVPIYREWLATTVGLVTAQIRPKVNGYVLTQEYQEGAVVKEGTLLFTIDPRQYQNSFDQARGKVVQSEAQLRQARAQVAENESQVKQAQAQVAQVESDLARAAAIQVKTDLEVMRYRPLASRGSISQQELDNAVQNNLANLASVEAERANLEKARASVERAQAALVKARADVAAAEAAIVQAQAALAETQLNLGWTKVHSPITGVAGIKKASIGDLVNPLTVLTTVALIDPIYAQFNPSEQEYLRWQAGRKGELARRPNFELILSDGQVHPHRGTAEIVGLEVDPTTGTIPVRATFPNPGNVLRPGQYGKVRVPVVVKQGALLVPQRAVRDLQGIYQVGVVASGDTVAMRTVQVGERVGTLWLIEKGLQPGDRIIVEGIEKVRAGEKVAPTVVEADPAGESRRPVTLPADAPGSRPAPTPGGIPAPATTQAPGGGPAALPPAGRTPAK